MGWIIGTTGSDTLLRKLIKQIHPPPLFVKESDKLYIAAGSKASTCFYHSDELNAEGWIAVGTGLKRSSQTYKLMNSDDWDQYVSELPAASGKIDGHYTLLRWKDENLKVETDRLGLRDFYLSQYHESMLFSARLDWIGKLIRTDFDIKNLGNAWLLSNNLSTESLLKDIIWITKCRECTITKETFNTISWNDLFNLNVKSSAEEVHCELEKIVKGLLDSSEQLELSLSGGLDSRVLLSYLLKFNRDKFSTHTFGNPNHPDNQISEKLSEKLNFNHRNFYTPLEDDTNLVNNISEFILLKRLSTSVTEYLNLRFYDSFVPGTIIIDGGAGGLWRNELLYKLKTIKKKSVTDNNVDNLFKFFYSQKADIFNEDAVREMSNYVKIQIEKTFSELPVDEVTGLNNIIDILLFNTMIPNLFSPEQSRIDNYSISVMPFLQPSLVKLFSGIEDELKINGKMVRNIIKNNYNQLENFKLVKGNILYPYHSGHIKMRVISRLKSSLGLQYKESDKLKLLYLLKDFAMDIVNSQSLKNYHLYDYKKIKTLVENFYKGSSNLSSEVDWWLSFEIFRKNISEN
jgi:hypothetical protein